MKTIDKKPYAPCEAKTKNGIPCENLGMANGRCGMHGGKSTGPRTPEGKERIRKANWKHGKRSAQAREQHKNVRIWLDEASKLSEEIRDSAGILTPQELDAKFDQLRQLDAKLEYAVENYEFLSVKDLICLDKYFLRELQQCHDVIGFLISKGVSKGNEDDHIEESVEKSSFKVGGVQFIVSLHQNPTPVPK